MSGGLIAAVKIGQKKKIGLNGQIVLGPQPMLEGKRTDLKLVSGYVMLLSFWAFRFGIFFHSHPFSYNNFFSYVFSDTYFNYLRFL